ncbi:MAG: sensor protein fixL [Chthoniobacteraceae bacterium]|nr:sensor protein fixL [Chthoniobacteraceae bacterium]
MVKVLAAELHADNPVKAAQLEELGEVIDRALEEARHLFTQLQPVMPGEDGLMTALARLASETSIQTPCDFECENAVLINNPEAALALYRVAAEAVKNAVDHANARRIKISLVDPDGVIALKVSDDGRGFVPQTASGAVHGSELMRLRAQTAGGALTSESELGHGTTVTFTLPKNEAQA